MIDRLNAALEGRYEIERELGEGGMATGLLAEDLRHKRNVALKVLTASLVGEQRRGNQTVRRSSCTAAVPMAGISCGCDH